MPALRDALFLVVRSGFLGCVISDRFLGFAVRSGFCSGNRGFGIGRVISKEDSAEAGWLTAGLSSAGFLVTKNTISPRTTSAAAAAAIFQYF